MTDRERLDEIKTRYWGTLSSADVAWLIQKVEESLICGAVYRREEWPHHVVCVRRPGHDESPSPTWDDRDHRGHPESEAWTWRDE